MCLAQGPQRSDACEAQTMGPSVSSQALYHWATVLPNCVVNSYQFARGDFCRLQVTFANSLAPDQDRQNVGPDLDPNCLTLW